MKETVKTSRTAGYLEKIFRALNERYFDGELQEPVITLTDTPRAYGHVTVSKTWLLANRERRHELNIGAGTLDRDITEVVSTLLHEAVHLYHLQEGVQDTSRGGRYHNKKFREAAEMRDLKISYDPKIGWSITEPTEALIDFIISQGWGDIKMNREGGYTATGGPGKSTGAAGIGTAPRRTSSTRKVWCPCCKQSVRATRHVSIICGICHIPMVEVGA